VSRYVVVETRDPSEFAEVTTTYELCRSLAGRGSPVTVYLAQNGVFPVRKTSAAAQHLSTLTAVARVWADDFSLRERGIADDELAPDIGRASIDSLVDLITGDDAKVIWR
jgi:sulfur transfer complex TusBCD TusB component (DsrH family)